ncbi:MAG: porin [Alphaproteobacteria bacterium]|nr:porin [Alphaproteobacteria bacterium]
MREMRRVLLGGAVLLGVLALPVGASAEEYGYDYGGYANFSGYLFDQDDFAGANSDSFGFAADAHVRGHAKVILDDGIELGVRAQLRFESSEARFSDDDIRGAPQILDKFFVYMQHAFGRLSIGDDYGAAKQNGIFSPLVSEANRIDDARHYALQDPLRSDFTPYAPNGAHIRTDLNASGEAFKIQYASPRLIGAELDVSYTPKLTRGLNDLFNGRDEFDRQSNIWEANLSFQRSLGGFDFGVYAGYLTGDNERPSVVVLPVVAPRLSDGVIVTFASNAFRPDDVEEYGFGGQVAYEGFKLGGSWRHTNVAGGGPLQDHDVFPFASTGCIQVGGCVLPNANTEVWGAGLTYETGPWLFGVNYANLHEELPPYVDSTVLAAPTRHLAQDAEAWQGTVGYEIDTGIDVYLGYQRYNFDGPTAQCSAVACDSMDANIGFLQTAFSFP